MSALRDAILLKLQATGGVTALVGQRIYPDMPPEGAQFPQVVVISQQAPKAGRVFQGVAYEDAVYLVKAIDANTSPKKVGAINAAIRAALELAQISIAGYTSLGIAWVQDVAYTEENSGQIYQHEGGFYSLMATAT